MKKMRTRNDAPGGKRRQTGLALIAMLMLIGLWGLYLFVGQLSATRLQAERAGNAAAALAEARETLIGDAILRLPVSDAAYLRMPDLGSNAGVASEGRASLTFSGDGKDFSVVGKFPWKTLSSAVPRDESGECLWYVVSGRFKIDTPLLKTDVLNWDTQGQINVFDGSGNAIASKLAALIVAPGRALSGQSRTLADPVYTECGGNYDARNYLDPFDSSNNIAGHLNYFILSTNNRVARTEADKGFVMTGTDYYNDRFLLVTVEDVFNPLIKRSDFATAIDTLLATPAFQTVAITGPKGTGPVDPSDPSFNLFCSTAADVVFCKNWKEMLLLTQLPTPAQITIDGVLSANCNRVVIFGGRRTTGQSRNNATEKLDKNNYLEGANASSFNAPIATATTFSGASTFDFRSPSTDLIRCLP